MRGLVFVCGFSAFRPWLDGSPASGPAARQSIMGEVVVGAKMLTAWQLRSKEESSRNGLGQRGALQSVAVKVQELKKANSYLYPNPEASSN